MSLLLFCAILIALAHYFFQNVILPALIATRTERIMKILSQFNEMRKKNTIPVKIYGSIKKVLISTCVLFDDESEFEAVLNSSVNETTDLSDDETYQNFEWIKNSANVKAKELIAEYLLQIRKILVYQAYAWLIYLLPIILYRIFFRKMRKRVSPEGNNWTVNIIKYSNHERSLAYY